MPHTKKSTTKSGKTSRKIISLRNILIIFLVLIVAYIILDIWAIKKIEVDTSQESILNSVSNIKFTTNATESTIETAVQIKNPTIIPIIISKVSYEIKYADIIVGQGHSGFIFMNPRSNMTTAAKITIDHKEAAKAAAEAIVNILQKNKESLTLNIYALFGPIKIQVKG